MVCFFCGIDTPDPQSSGKETAGNRDEKWQVFRGLQFGSFRLKSNVRFFPLRLPASHIIKGYWKPGHNCKNLPSLHLYMRICKSSSLAFC